ncbi:MAG: hypothetical protein WB471_00065 [Nocardioides sp.]
MTTILSGVLAAIALTATLLTVSSTVAPAAGVGASATYGSTLAKRQTLRSGCHAYRFAYRVTAPGDDWMAEISLVSPDGDSLVSHSYKGTAGDPRKASRRFRFCDVSTSPGRHTITMLVTSYDSYDEDTRRSDPTRFRLTQR